MTAFESMANSLMNIDSTFTTCIVTRQEYEQWEKTYLIDALAGKRLGQSFCEYFSIGNASPLYHFKDNRFSERWIKDQYLV
jgi:hypothetical protein